MKNRVLGKLCIPHILVCLIEILILLFMVRGAIKAPLSVVYEELFVVDENESGTVLLGDEFDLRSGAAYDIQLDYKENHTEDGGIGYLQLYSDTDDVSYVKSEIFPVLTLDSNVKYGRMYVPVGKHASNVSFQLVYGANEYVEIDRIYICEKPVWQWIKVIAFFILFGGIDLIILYFNKIIHWKDYNIALALLLIILGASLPVFAAYLYDGHDLAFHLERIGSVAHELSYGHFPVRYYGDIINGYGYPTPIYYCDLFLYIPAILYNMMVPLYTCYHVYVLLINSVTCIFAFLCFRELGKNKELGVVGSLLYTLGAYRIACLDVRGAVGEYTALAFIPLIIVAIYKIYISEQFETKNAILLGIGMSGICMCHTLSLEISACVLAIFVIFTCNIVLNKYRLYQWILAGVICVLISLWWLVPFVSSYIYAEVRVLNASSINRIQETGAHLIQLINPFYTYGGDSISYTTTAELPLSLGAGAILGIIVFAFYISLQNRVSEIEQKNVDSNDSRFITKIFLVSIITTCMASIHFPWNAIAAVGGEAIAKIVGSIQFSWRYIGWASALLLTVLILILKQLKTRREIYYLIIAIACGLTIITYLDFLRDFTNSDHILTEFYSDINVSTNVANGEYLLNESIPLQWKAEENLEPVVIDGEVYIESYSFDKGNKKLVVSDVISDAIVKLPVYAYTNMQVIDSDTANCFMAYKESDGCLVVKLPAGFNGELLIQYSEPFMWKVTEIISVFGIIGICVWWILDKYGRANKTKQI